MKRSTLVDGKWVEEEVEDLNVSNPDPPKRIRTDEPLGTAFVGTGEYVVLPVDLKLTVYGPFHSSDVAHAWGTDWGLGDFYVRKLITPCVTIPEPS